MKLFGRRNQQLGGSTREENRHVSRLSELCCRDLISDDRN